MFCRVWAHICLWAVKYFGLVSIGNRALVMQLDTTQTRWFVSWSASNFNIENFSCWSIKAELLRRLTSLQVATGQVASTGMVALSYVQKLSEKVTWSADGSAEIWYPPSFPLYFYFSTVCRFLWHQISCTTTCQEMWQLVLVMIISLDRCVFTKLWVPLYCLHFPLHTCERDCVLSILCGILNLVPIVGPDYPTLSPLTKWHVLIQLSLIV